MEMKTLESLYIEQLKDLHSAEKQLTKALPKMAKAAQSKELKDGFTRHLSETETHLERLDKILGEWGQTPGRKKCKAMEGLIAEADDFITEGGDPEVMDAGLIAHAQRVEHYEIAGYGCARTYAGILGKKNDMKALQTTLDEEGMTDKALTELAENVINLQAAQ
jgi:ferritin-like metal-binding protein YciE